MNTDIGLEFGTLDGRVAVITGAGRGIGYEAARALTAMGARVVLAEQAERGREAAAALTAAGGEALWVQTDVADAASVARLVEETRAAFGPVDILVNNAIVSPVVPLIEMDAAEWDRVIAVNLRGAFLTCKDFLPDMLAQQRGVIVNMVSTDAMPGLAAYIASKQGIVGLSQSLALEVGDCGVHVVAFAPGMVDTPGIRDVAQGLAPHLGMTRASFLSVTLHPAYENRLMPAEDAGAATAYLIARLAEEYHGEVVDGYEVLERAGYLDAAGDDVAMDAPASSAPAGPSPGGLLSQVEALQRILVETGAEFEQLPIFARPLARRGFKRKSGASFQMWAQRLEALHARIQAGDAAWLAAQSPDLRAALERLAVYYREVPEETARFTRDEAVLREIGRVAAQRVAAIRQLRSELG